MIPTADEVRAVLSVGDEVYIEGSLKLSDGFYKIASVSHISNRFPIYLEAGYNARLEHINLFKSSSNPCIGGE